MPKAGFKTFTVNDAVYEHFWKVWQKCKDDMVKEGVSSFSGYIAYLMEKRLRVHDIFTKYQIQYEKILIEKTRIVLRDCSINRIIELKRTGVHLECLFCKRKDCVHVGFCYSFHQIYS